MKSRSTRTRSSRIEMAEWVLPGHPDKLCDAAVDAIVEAVSRADRLGQCGLEAACVFDRFFLTGRIAAGEAAWEKTVRDLDLDALIRGAYRSAGYGPDRSGYVWGPHPEDIKIEKVLCLGPFAEGEREMRHLSDDQAICVGYANAMAETNHMPPAHWLARRIARALVALRLKKGAGQVGPDGKVIVRVQTDGTTWEPVHVSISLNHHIESDWMLLRRIAEEAVAVACRGKQPPKLEINGAGMFISGGPNGDNGQTGKKLVMDAYGPTVPIGGGAWSGKDLNKVDRVGGWLARKIALWAVRQYRAGDALVTLSYVPGGEAPAGMEILLDCRSRAATEKGAGKVMSLKTRDYATEMAQCRARLVNVARWRSYAA